MESYDLDEVAYVRTQFALSTGEFKGCEYVYRRDWEPVKNRIC